MATAEEIIINIGNQMAPIVDLIIAAAYVIGVWLIVSAILRFKKASEHTMASAYQTELGPAFAGLFMGAALIWLPQFFDTVTITVFGNDSATILSQQPNLPSSHISEEVWLALLRVMAVIGLIAFVRGTLIIHKTADGQGASQGGGLGKGITHVVGGVLCYHIEAFFNVLKDTLGVASLF